VYIQDKTEHAESPQVWQHQHKLHTQN